MSDYDEDGELFHLTTEPDYIASILASGSRAGANIDAAFYDFEDYAATPPRRPPRSSPSLRVSEFRSIVEAKRETTTAPASVVDLRSVDYVTIPNENLVCAICTSPFISPVELSCEHIFCEACLYDHLTSGIQSASLCPKCRDPIQSIRPTSRLLTQLLDELEVKCPNEPSGCEGRHKRYTIHDHLSSYCEFEEVSCPSMECVHYVQRRLLSEKCLHSQVSCHDCEEEMLELAMKDHLDLKCRHGVVQCTHCEVQMRRGELGTHHSEECKMIPTSCKGHIIGCPFTGPRHTVNDHMKLCPIAIMAPHFQEQNERHVQLQQDTTQVRDQLHDLESKFEELEASFKQLSTSIKRERRRSLATGGTVSASRVEEITGRLDELATDYNSRLDNATSDNARMHMAFMNENLRNQQQFHTLNATLTVMRNQLNHLAALRATGSNATAGSGTGATNSGSSGVMMDSGRREPPKL